MTNLGPMPDELPPIPTQAEVQRDPSVLHAFNDRIVRAFRANRGVVAGPFQGANVALVSITGARTGITRVTPLEYFMVDDRLILLGTYGGAPKNPAWVHNLRAHANVLVEIGEQSFPAVAHELADREAEEVFAEVASRVPRVAAYPTPARRIPVFEVRPV
ncbi:nitroreductase/quinone reductase family protein [Mycolicibacterium mengxianglii]|uniref:nitroreductase/quinone reductase family protein n=1 Tax=Mycolicibacterium mengxianglii TaxID=2736649 RepID=UPI0018D1E807|nr:nitroreductase/quinone reductase family protein [Mycolicibacterium mengxianglii]